jgi:hypothetical protein
MNTRFFVLTGFLVAVSACSLLLDRRADQCSTDGDCAKFAGTTCDSAQRLCVVAAHPFDGGNPPASDSGANAETAPPSPDAAPDASSDPCLGANGCYACAPSNDHQFGGACTDAVCKGFDNSRIKKLSSDGGLTPLPPPREAGAPPSEGGTMPPPQEGGASSSDSGQTPPRDAGEP